MKTILFIGILCLAFAPAGLAQDDNCSCAPSALQTIIVVSPGYPVVPIPLPLPGGGVTTPILMPLPEPRRCDSSYAYGGCGGCRPSRCCDRTDPYSDYFYIDPY